MSEPYLDRFPPEYEERLCSLSEKACELVDQDVFDFVGLLYSDADSNTVDAGFDQDFLVLIAGNR
jgi:hypothetical protein